MAPKENFLAYSVQLIFFKMRLVPGNMVMVAIVMRGKVVMVAIVMCGKGPIPEEWIYGIT